MSILLSYDSACTERLAAYTHTQELPSLVAPKAARGPGNETPHTHESHMCQELVMSTTASCAYICAYKHYWHQLHILCCQCYSGA